MDLTIHQNCPSCGADIVLSEADRLIDCPYCDVKNFMVTRGPLRFMLPHKAPDHILPQDMLYAPYLRFKGNVFYCKGKFLKHKVVDTTQQGMLASALPPSLGLRPQAMPVILVTDKIVGYFLPQTIKAKTLVERAAQLTVIDSESIKFTDENNNKAIDASENCKISFELQNTGKGEAIDLILKIVKY